MKKCPFCGEEIQNEAKKCRYCGERIETKEEKNKKNQKHYEEKKINNKEPGYMKDLEKIETKIGKIDAIQNIKAFFLKYIRFQKQKRISKKGFGVMFLVFLTGLGLAALISVGDSEFLMMLSFIIYLGLLILLIEKAIKRSRDIGMGMSLIYVIIAIIIAMGVLGRENELQSIVLFLKGIIGVIILYMILVLFLKKSIDGESKWGPKPKD